MASPWRIIINKTPREVQNPTPQQWQSIMSHAETLEMVGRAAARNRVQLRDGASLYGNDPKDRRVVDSMLIQTRGDHKNPQCSHCEEERGPYLQCIAVAGWFGGACGNCKRHDKAASCTISQTYKDAKEEREKQEKEKEKESFTSKRGRATEKPVSYKE